MFRIVLVAAMGCVLVTTGCGSDPRPTAGEWRPEWGAARDLVPDAAALEAEGAELCGEFLGQVREQREELTPAPNDAIEDAFTSWAEEAESLGLDCADADDDDLEDRLAEIERLAEKVDRAVAAA